MDIVLLAGILLAIIAGVVIIAVAARGIRPKMPEAQTYTPPPVTARTAATSHASAASGLTAETIAEIDRLVAGGHTIQAVRLYRDRTGATLQDAKDRIDHWSISTTAPHATVSHAAVPHAGSAHRSSIPASVALEIDRLIAAGQKIAAVKLLRAHTGLGLKESKKAIDAWRPGR